MAPLHSPTSYVGNAVPIVTNVSSSSLLLVMFNIYIMLSRNHRINYTLLTFNFNTVNLFLFVVVRASVNILQSGVSTSMVLNLDVRYALTIKSDVTLALHTGRKKTILTVCMQ